MEFKPLENDLLSLVKLKEDDFDKLFEVAADSEIWKDHPDFTRYTFSGFKVFFEHLLNTNQPFLVVENRTKHIIGATSYYNLDLDKKSVAIGYTFLVMSHHGGIYNQSMKNLMINYAFQYLDHVVFHVREFNYRSQKALLRIGARKTKEYPAPNDPNSIQYEFMISKNSY
ncbi:GNAT family N-acetyltransferase [Sphingobacterium bovistauri]|uniref:GNAT family N-acetyltransferase n=1 Tax=Sphingobacterium bovistauri TaxID=2781959 RepID=A0ABS7Z3Z3_9SPHI|nr:GNAT family N-acetyltransferase [Sphingobacterium bovistauri]MCA5004898.1 GNAT family N-acetyltransferase [Sphingobacterium bovistauri]